MWGQHLNIKNQISQHFADRCLGIRENIGKLFIIILASLIWLIICWHQDRSIIFPIYVQSFIFTKKNIFFDILSELILTVRNSHKIKRSPTFITRRLCWWWWWYPKHTPRWPSWAVQCSGGNPYSLILSTEYCGVEVKQTGLMETDLIIWSLVCLY